MIVVTEIVNTCSSCPNQWEGKTDSGKIIYIRFRSDELTIGMGPTIDDAVKVAMNYPTQFAESRKLMDIPLGRNDLSFHDLKRLTESWLNLPDYQLFGRSKFMAGDE